MISHTNKFVFIHIPKCAGTSIESALRQLDDEVRSDRRDHRTVRQIKWPDRAIDVLRTRDNTVWFVKQLRDRLLLNPQMTVSQAEFNEYFKFAIVRNPWTRAYSLYKGIMRDERLIKTHGLSSDIPFSEFLHFLSGRRMLRPQLSWLTDFTGRIAVDFIGFFENLERDFHRVCDLLEFKYPELPHSLYGDTDDYQEQYDEHSIEIVRRIYREEIEVFGYRFPK